MQATFPSWGLAGAEAARELFTARRTGPVLTRTTFRLDRMRARNVNKLVGCPGCRLRVGDWRMIYTLDAGRLVVRVLDIGARGGVYQ